MKYVIVGNGMVALSIAFRLHQRLSEKDEVFLIGPNERIGCASMAAGAMLNSFGEIEIGSLKSETDVYHFELSHMAARWWPKFEEELIEAAGEHLPKCCEKCEILKGGGCYDCGTFIVNNCAADELDDRNFEAILTALDDFDEPHELVDPKDIPNYYPSQHVRASRALYIHDEGWLNPRIVIEKLDAILCHSPKIKIVDAKVDKFVQSGNKIEATILEDGRRIEGDVFLLAAGAVVNSIIEKSELALNLQPIFYGVGVSMEIKSADYPHEKCVRTPNRGGACGTYTVPFFQCPDHPNDHILIGASNQLRVEPVFHGRISSIQHLMQSAIEEINGHFYNAELLRTNIGWRPTSLDTYPLLGKTAIDNFVIASGTKRDGFHLAPVISDYLAKIMMGEPVDERFDCFRPDRDLIRELSRKDAVDLAVVNLMSEQYQHGYRPSGIPMNKQVMQSYRDQIERLHDSVGAVDWGIPPLMLSVYRKGYVK